MDAIMNAKEAQKKLKHLFSKIFGTDNVIAEWPSRKKAKDWLSDCKYAPRPDIVVGPLNISEGNHSKEIERSFKEFQTFFNKLHIENCIRNENPRCLIALEIENSNRGKHMIGNIINASILGKVGIIVTLRTEFYQEAEKVNNYLEGAYKIKQMGHKPSNVVIKSYSYLEKYLLEYIESNDKNNR